MQLFVIKLNNLYLGNISYREFKLSAAT